MANSKLENDILTYLYELKMKHGDCHFSVEQIAKEMKLPIEKLHDYETNIGILIDLYNEGLIDRQVNSQYKVCYALTEDGIAEVLFGE